MSYFLCFFFFYYHFNLKSTTGNRYDVFLEILQTFFKAILYGNKLMYLKSMKTYKKFLLQYCWCWLANI